MTEVATLGLKVDGTANIDNATQSLDRFSKSGQDAEKSADSLSRGSQKSSKSLADVARQSDVASRGMSKLASAARSAGALIVASLGGLSFGRVIKETAGFEQSLLGLQVVSGATAKQMKELERQSRTLGATSMFSAQQAADAQNYLAMAGFSVNEVLSATPGLLELAAAGAMDLASAADLASNVLGGFRLQVDELGRVNDVLAAAAAGSNTSIQQLGQAMSYAAPIAAAAGVSIEQTAAAIGVLSDAGLQGSRAGTGLLGVIRQLSNLTPNATSALSAYGLTAADVNVEQRGLNEVLQALSEANINAADSFKIFGSEAGPAAQILASGAVRVNEFTGELELAEGAARRAALILGSGLQGSFKSLTSAIGESTLQLGRDSGLSAGLQEVIDYATGVISVYNGMLDIFQDANDLSDDQTRSLNNTATALALAAGATGGLSAAYVVLTGAIWAANAAMTAFFRLLRVNPLVLAASAAVALGGALYTARNRTVELGESTGTIGDYLLATWQEVSGRVQDYWAETVDNVIGWLDDIGVNSESVAREIKKGFTDTIDAVIYAFRFLFNNAVGTFSAMQTVAVGVADAISAAFTTMGSNARTIFDALWRDIQALLSLDFSTSHFTNAIENELISVADAVGRTVAATAGRVAEQLTEDHLGNIVNTASRYFDDLGTSIDNRVGTNQQVARLTEFSRNLLRLRGGAEETGEEVVVLGDAADNTVDTVDQLSASSKRAADAEKEHKRALQDSLSTYSALFKQISPAGAALEEYNATVASLTVAYEDGAKSALEYYAAIGQAAKNYNDAVRAADPNIKRVEELTRQYDAAHIKAEQLTKDLAAINLAWRENPQNGEQYARVVAGIRDEMQELALAADPAAQELAKSWEEAAKRIDETFADAFMGAFDSFESFSKQLMSGFKRLLAELAYQATLKPIVVGFTQDVQGIFGGKGGGFGNTIGAAKNLFSAGGSLFGGAIGPVANAGIMSSITSGISAATPWIGAALAIDSLLGGGITKAIGGLFSNKKTFDFGFQQGGNYGVFGDRESAFGQFGVTSFSDYKLEQQPELDALLNGLVELDNIIAAAALPERFDAIRASIEGFTHSGPEDLVETRLRAMIAGSGSAVADAVMQIADPQQLADAFVRVLQLEQIGQQLGGAVLGDIEAEINRQGTAQGVMDAANAMTTAANAAVMLADSSARLNLQFDVTASGAIHAASNLQALVGGVESLAALQSQYYDAFFTEQEKLDNLTGDLTETFGALGLALPDSREGVRSLVESLDIMGEMGQRQLAVVYQNVGALDQYIRAMDEQRAAAEQAAQAERELAAERSVSFSYGALVSISGALDDYNTAMSASSRIASERKAQLQDELRAVEQLSGLINSLMLSSQSILNPLDRLQESQRQLAELQTRAERGDVDAVNQLQGASTAYLDAAAAYYGQSSDQYASIFRDVTGSVGALEDQFADSARSLGTIEGIERQMLREQQRAHDALTRSLTQQINMTEGIYNLTDLMDALPDSLARALAGVFPGATTASGRAYTPGGIDHTGGALLTGARGAVADSYREIFGRDPDAAGLAYWESRASSGASIEEIRRSLRESAEGQERFATGAAFTNGVFDRPTAFPMGLMGEKTPEAIMPLANIGGSLGVNVAGAVNLEPLTRELQALRQEVAMLRAERRKDAAVAAGQRSQQLGVQRKIDKHVKLKERV